MTDGNIYHMAKHLAQEHQLKPAEGHVVCLTLSEKVMELIHRASDSLHDRKVRTVSPMRFREALLKGLLENSHLASYAGPGLPVPFQLWIEDRDVIRRQDIWHAVYQTHDPIGLCAMFMCCLAALIGTAPELDANRWSERLLMTFAGVSCSTEYIVGPHMCLDMHIDTCRTPTRDCIRIEPPTLQRINDFLGHTSVAGEELAQALQPDLVAVHRCVRPEPVRYRDVVDPTERVISHDIGPDGKPVFILLEVDPAGPATAVGEWQPEIGFVEFEDAPGWRFCPLRDALGV